MTVAPSPTGREAPPDRYCPTCGLPTTLAHCPADGAATFQRDTGAMTGELRTGDVIGGRYRVTGILGRGGFGAVFATEHTATGQAAAVKVLSSDTALVGSEGVQRFLREARVTASLKHPNTIRVYDFGQTDRGVFFMAMELLKGPTLERVIDRLANLGSAMSEAQALDIALPILRSLTEAHAAGLVHRDLKPANLILAEVVGEPPVVKILDFGIARNHDSSLTSVGTALGTPTYMSPEQGRGGKLDGRSDLYSVGCILHNCVTGSPPFEDANPMLLIMQHQLRPPPDLRECAKVPVSDAFIAAVTRAMAKTPQERFADAIAMRAALDAVRAALPGVPGSSLGPLLEAEALEYAAAAAEVPITRPVAAATDGPPPDATRAGSAVAPEPSAPAGAVAVAAAAKAPPAARVVPAPAVARPAAPPAAVVATAPKPAAVAAPPSAAVADAAPPSVPAGMGAASEHTVMTAQIVAPVRPPPPGVAPRTRPGEMKRETTGRPSAPRPARPAPASPDATWRPVAPAPAPAAAPDADKPRRAETVLVPIEAPARRNSKVVWILAGLAVLVAAGVTAVVATLGGDEYPGEALPVPVPSEAAPARTAPAAPAAAPPEPEAPAPAAAAEVPPPGVAPEVPVAAPSAAEAAAEAPVPVPAEPTPPPEAAVAPAETAGDKPTAPRPRPVKPRPKVKERDFELIP